MAFVNEYIPKEDFEKYNFDELNKRPSKGGDFSRDWTIDREADVWLRKFYTESDHTDPTGGYTGISAWDFFWKGTLITLEVMMLEVGGNRRQHCWSRKRLQKINIPSELENKRPKILKDLEAAFLAYKDGGVLASSTSYTLTFEI